MAEDRRLTRLTKICLALPEATRELHNSHASFAVRGRKFAYLLDDHHRDGLVAVSFRALPGENEVLIASDPTRFFMPSISAPGAGPRCTSTWARSTGTRSPSS